MTPATRFIPVGTGNTPSKRQSNGPGPVHPRGHGEHGKVLGVPFHGVGSSPWARGTHDNTVNNNNTNRFIPVGTGNTSWA